MEKLCGEIYGKVDAGKSWDGDSFSEVGKLCAVCRFCRKTVVCLRVNRWAMCNP